MMDKTTEAIRHDAAANDIEAALSALDAIGEGNVKVEIEPGGWRVEFIGVLAKTEMSLITASHSEVCY